MESIVILLTSSSHVSSKRRLLGYFNHLTYFLLQWAVQNAVGVLFTVLFTVVWRMTFTLACVSSALYGAGAQILSLDRTVGGRLFGGTIFVGCMLSGGVIGGAISSLAWVAHGSSKGLFHYFEEGLESPLLQNLTIVQDFEAEQLRTILGQGISFVESTTTQTIARELPEFLDNLNEDIFNALGSLFPRINNAYWALLIVFFAIVSLPFAVARAHQNLKVGILMAIATLFMGSQVVFATLTPILGIRQYWTQIVTGYIKVALVNCGAMCCTALLFFVKSSHDSVRIQMSQVLKDTGSLLSRISSNVNKQELDHKGGKQFVTEDQNQNVYEVVMDEVKALAEDSVLDGAGKQKDTNKIDEEENDFFVPMPSVHSGFEIRGNCQAIEDSLGICLFETPLPEITSHVGARRADFVDVLESLRTMLSTVCCMERIHMKASQELVSGGDLAPLTTVLAELAAIVLNMSHVLSDMDLWKPCKGEKVSWKPQGKEFWNTMQQKLVKFSDQTIDTINLKVSSKSASSQNDAMLLVLNCYSLIQDIKGCEFQVCKALDIAVDAIDESENEPKAESRGLKEKIFSNAYLPSIIIHGLLLSGAAVYGLVIMSCIKLIKGSKLVFSSGKDRLELLRDRHVQFAFKYWLGLSLTIMSIVLILWKEKFSSENQLQNAYDLTYFFFVWQPIYFWITAAICIQFQVEAAAFRAVLRTTMTAVGGTLGWFTMMNGRLANDAVFIGGITALFNGFCALASPIKEFRYSLFLTTFTFNAVVVCQYFGCCDVAGETNIYGGKVLSTLLGSVYSILVSWCILPYYTSTRMLDIEHEVLKDGLSLLRQLHEQNEQEVLQGKDEVNPQCESHPSLKTVTDTVDIPITAVHKELELNVVDKRQFLLLTWTLLPTPKIVPLLKGRLEAIGVFLREAIKLNSTPLWSSERNKDKVNSLLSEIKEDVERALEASEFVVAECKVTMDATSGRALNEARVNLASKVGDLGKARAKLRESFMKWDERHRQEKWSDIELKLLARSQLLIHTLREINVIGLLLSETEATLDRDRWLSWAASWFGRRPF